MKKSLKKLVALGLVVVMGAAMLVGCGGKKGETKDGKTEITLGYWDKNQKVAMENLKEAYEKSQDKVTVKLQLTPYKEYWNKLEASATGGTAPDVFWVNVLHLDSYLDGQILADITDAVKGSDINDGFAKVLVNNYVRDGKNYAVPKDFDTNALWYNKELFDKAGVAYPTDDMTYEDLKALCKELKDKLPKGV